MAIGNFVVLLVVNELEIGYIKRTKVFKTLGNIFEHARWKFIFIPPRGGMKEYRLKDTALRLILDWLTD